MAVRKFKPVTAGTRHKIIGTFEEITKSTPEKSLLAPKKSTGGRNNTGKMTMRYIGGGHKQMYRMIDFRRSKDGIAATVKSIEYDPNRTARIALLVYADGVKSYIIAPNGLQVGQTVMSGTGVAPEVVMGTFSLAVAFAGNDLVNFIGVPLSGLASYQDLWLTAEGTPKVSYGFT